MLTSDEKEQDFKRTVENEEGSPLGRPHAVYPQVTANGSLVTIHADPLVYITVSRTAARRLLQELQDELRNQGWHDVC